MTQPISAIKFCPDCGERNNACAKFCYRCGLEIPALPPTSLIQNQLKKQHAALLVIVFVLAVLGCGVIVLISTIRSNKTAFSRDVRFGNIPASQAKRGVTFAQFDQLQNGISYNQAVAVLGSPGTEISRVELAGTLTVMYKWDGENLGGNMNAMFQNNRLISKAQIGLK